MWSVLDHQARGRGRDCYPERSTTIEADAAKACCGARVGEILATSWRALMRKLTFFRRRCYRPLVAACNNRGRRRQGPSRRWPRRHQTADDAKK